MMPYYAGIPVYERVLDLAMKRGDMTFAEANRTGELDGYRNGPPPWVNREMTGIDAEVCAEETCPHCGHKGLGCRQYHNSSTRTYRAFAVCSCGYSDEF